VKELFITGTRARLRTWLAAGYALFIVYVSLSPFTGWRAQGLDFLEVLGAPLRFTYTAFDMTVNLLSYLPFGLLAGLAFHARFGVAASVFLAWGLGVALSAGMEYLQMYLPARISSNVDMLANGAGALLGALLAVSLVSRTGLLDRLMYWRRNLFHQGSEMDFGMALLALWVFGQSNPSLPMLGNVFIAEAARQPFAVPPPAPFDGWESGAVALNLLMLGVLLMTLLRVPRHAVLALLVILAVVALAKFVTAALLLKSWALLLWINSEAALGMLLGTALLFLLLTLPRGAAIIAGALVSLGYIAVVHFVFADNTPAAALSIYHWHYGHLLNYAGLAQTIMLVFPLLLLFHLWRVRKV
jgi:VanZ family protein